MYTPNDFFLLRFKTSNGEIGTGWVDKGYKAYGYKQCCPYHVSIRVDLTDQIAQHHQDLDMGTVEDFLSEELKKICICHMVSRLASEKGMDIELYVEHKTQVEVFLTKAQQDENRLFTFDYEIGFDPKWKKATKLLSL